MRGRTRVANVSTLNVAVSGVVPSIAASFVPASRTAAEDAFRAAGAIAALRPGAHPSLPTAAELEEILAR